MKLIEEIFSDGLDYLRRNGLKFEANPKAMRLRLLALEFTRIIVRKERPLAAFLSGSSIIGNSGKGSDIDIDVIVSKHSKPIKKLEFEGTPVDLATCSLADWRGNYIKGANLRYLTHSVPLYIKEGKILHDWQQAIKKFYSANAYKKEYKRINQIVTERSQAIEYYKAHDRLFLSILPIESCFDEVVNLFIYKNKGCPSNSTMLEELNRLSQIFKKDWYKNALILMRFDSDAKQLRKYIRTYCKLFERMRILLSENYGIVKKLNGMQLGLFGACRHLRELTSRINEQQLIDKADRSIGRKQEFNVGLSLMQESQYNFFMFTPFFYVKNIDRNASDKALAKMPFNVGFEAWDPDIKQMWKEVARINHIDLKTILELNQLNHEILEECKP